MSSSPFDPKNAQALKNLKKQLQQKAQQDAAHAKEATKHEAQQLTDAQLFAQATQGVQPIQDQHTIAITTTRSKRNAPSAQILAKRAAATGAEGSTDTQGISDTHALLNPVASEEKLSYRLATLQHRVFEQLKTGKLRWYEAVDLHGCTIEQARSAVLQIIAMAQAENQTVIKIVHGKGPQATLKTCVNGWLRQHQAVLAFVSAPAEQGGTGAVLVLLKRNEPKNSPRTRTSR